MSLSKELRRIMYDIQKDPHLAPFDGERKYHEFRHSGLDAESSPNLQRYTSNTAGHGAPPVRRLHHLP